MRARWASLESREPSSGSSRSAGRKGSREPRLKELRGNPAYSEGEDACALSEDLGLSLFPWQRDVLDIWCARDEGGLITSQINTAPKRVHHRPDRVRA